MNDVFLGIDLGTSSVKVIAVDATARVVGSAQEHYVVDRPHPRWAEQDPAEWWIRTARAIRQVLAGGSYRVRSIGLSGQMHGLVLLDGAGLPLRKAIIWSDSRTGAQAEEWRRLIGDDVVRKTTGFPIATGMFALSLHWVRDNEPEVYARAHTAISPKDYLRFRLTDIIGTEPTDAGATLAFDIHRRLPAEEILDAVGLRADLLAELSPSLRAVGELTTDAANETGLVAGTPVAAGGGDQAMAALALGLNDPSRAAVAISSGGTVIKPTPQPLDALLGLHVLPHAVAGTWLARGVVLSAGLGLDWLTTRLFRKERGSHVVAGVLEEAGEIAPGADGLLFSANLGGTRTPVVDADLRASLVGLGFQHGQAHIARAMVEGICIELHRSLATMTASGEHIRDLIISGGGARSPLWRQILSDVTGLPVHVSADVDHSALGAAFAGAISQGEALFVDFAGYIRSTVYPDPKRVEIYRNVAAELRDVETALAHRKEVQL